MKFLCFLALVLPTSRALQYDERYVDWNLNTNEAATRPADYAVSYPNHTYHPSPANWRMPFYSFFLDRFVNGDPTNDDVYVATPLRTL